MDTQLRRSNFHPTFIKRKLDNIYHHSEQVSIQYTKPIPSSWNRCIKNNRSKLVRLTSDTGLNEQVSRWHLIISRQCNKLTKLVYPYTWDGTEYRILKKLNEKLFPVERSTLWNYIAHRKVYLVNLRFQRLSPANISKNCSWSDCVKSNMTRFDKLSVKEQSHWNYCIQGNTNKLIQRFKSTSWRTLSPLVEGGCGTDVLNLIHDPHWAEETHRT